MFASLDIDALEYKPQQITKVAVRLLMFPPYTVL